MKHTAGSWNLKTRGPGHIITADNGEHVAQLTAGPADARLMNDSPDMLATLETLVSAIDEGMPTSEILNYIGTQARSIVERHQ